MQWIKHAATGNHQLHVMVTPLNHTVVKFSYNSKRCHVLFFMCCSNSVLAGNKDGPHLEIYKGSDLISHTLFRKWSSPISKHFRNLSMRFWFGTIQAKLNHITDCKHERSITINWPSFAFTDFTYRQSACCFWKQATRVWKLATNHLATLKCVH